MLVGSTMTGDTSGGNCPDVWTITSGQLPMTVHIHFRAREPRPNGDCARMHTSNEAGEASYQGWGGFSSESVRTIPGARLIGPHWQSCAYPLGNCFKVKPSETGETVNSG
jgi:hypothetical protein